MSYNLQLPEGSYPIRICGWKAVPAHSSASFDYSALSPSPTWNFPANVPVGHNWWITDLAFQSKNIKNPNSPGTLRSSYAVFNSVFTLPEHCPFMTFHSPIILPAGFVLSGSFINQSDEEQNMIVAAHGFAVPVST